MDVYPTHTPTPAPRDSTGQTLVLVGAVIGIVFGILMLMMALSMLMMAALFDDFARGTGMPAFFGTAVTTMLIFIAALALLNVVGIVLAFQGRGRVAAGDARSGWVRALVGGCLLLVGNTIAGVLVVIGAVLIKSDLDRSAAPMG